MYAVIETGGKQYRVELGTELAVERLDALPGTTINLERVLLVADGDNASVGTPTVADALVTADVLRQDRADKVIVFKYRPKARHRAKKGHRQEQTVLRVADIRFNGRSAADEAGTQKSDKQQQREQAKADAERKAAADQALASKLAAEGETSTADSTSAAPKTKAAAVKKPETTAASTKSTATKATAAAPAKSAATKSAATKPASSAAKAPATKAAAKPKTTGTSSTRSSTKKDK
jgi:large subunit ribosomal protein L21